MDGAHARAAAASTVDRWLLHTQELRWTVHKKKVTQELRWTVHPKKKSL
jgi:hypothetical protein